MCPTLAFGLSPRATMTSLTFSHNGLDKAESLLYISFEIFCVSPFSPVMNQDMGDSSRGQLR
jgi:hypothetical protein